MQLLNKSNDDCFNIHDAFVFESKAGPIYFEFRCDHIGTSKKEVPRGNSHLPAVSGILLNTLYKTTNIYRSPDLKISSACTMINNTGVDVLGSLGGAPLPMVNGENFNARNFFDFDRLCWSIEKLASADMSIKRVRLLSWDEQAKITSQSLFEMEDISALRVEGSIEAFLVYENQKKANQKILSASKNLAKKDSWGNSRVAPVEMSEIETSVSPEVEDFVFSNASLRDLKLGAEEKFDAKNFLSSLKKPQASF